MVAKESYLWDLISKSRQLPTEDLRIRSYISRIRDLAGELVMCNERRSSIYPMKSSARALVRTSLLTKSRTPANKVMMTTR